MLAGMIEPTSEASRDDHPLHYGDYSFRSQRIRMIFRTSTSPESRQRISRIADCLRLNTDLGRNGGANGCRDDAYGGSISDRVSYYPHMLAPGRNSVWAWPARADFTP